MRNKKIALIEDNADNRLLIKAILEEQLEIFEYESGNHALEDFKKNKPDLILLDIALPGMNGTKVLQQLRSNASLKNIPVIALTAHAMEEDRDKYLENGFDDYISKPIVDEKIFLNIIGKYIKTK